MALLAAKLTIMKALVFTYHAIVLRTLLGVLLIGVAEPVHDKYLA
jgi:hypothetical protein